MNRQLQLYQHPGLHQEAGEENQKAAQAALWLALFFMRIIRTDLLANEGFLLQGDFKWSSDQVAEPNWMSSSLVNFLSFQ